MLCSKPCQVFLQRYLVLIHCMYACITFHIKTCTHGCLSLQHTLLSLAKIPCFDPNAHNPIAFVITRGSKRGAMQAHTMSKCQITIGQYIHEQCALHAKKFSPLGTSIVAHSIDSKRARKTILKPARNLVLKPAL